MNMGLFSKEIRDYKVMEKYKKSLDAFFVFGETERYRLYLDKRLKQYILRQDKQNPKNVVYLGWLRGQTCIFFDKIFYINQISYTGRVDNPLNYIDIETGNAGNMNVLSNKGAWFAMHWHCRDIVQKIYIQQNTLVIDVNRYKEDSHSEKECLYSIHITYDANRFNIERIFTETSVEEQNKQQKNTDVCDKNVNSLHTSVSDVKKPGLTYGDDIALQTKTENVVVNKVTYDLETIASGLAELATKEYVDLVGFCGKNNILYDERKLFISTFAYYYKVWMFNFTTITVGQAEKIEAVYKQKFSAFNRKMYEEDSYKAVLSNEEHLEEMLSLVDKSIRTSYHENNYTFIDDGLTDSFILSFITNLEDKGKIKESIAKKIFDVWAYTAKQAEKQMIVE